MKPAEVAKRLNVSVDRIRTYCRIAGVEKVGCVYDIPEEVAERWRMHPPGTALDYDRTVAGRALKGQPIAGENYNPDNDDVRLARAYRQAKIDLRIALAEVSRVHRLMAKIQRFFSQAGHEHAYGPSQDDSKDTSAYRAILDTLAEFEGLA